MCEYAIENANMQICMKICKFACEYANEHANMQMSGHVSHSSLCAFTFPVPRYKFVCVWLTTNYASLS